MDALQKILVPTDFSPHADEAFRVALTLARATGGSVIVFHVARPPAVVSEGGRLLADPVLGEPVNLWDRFQRLQPPGPGVRVEHEVIVSARPSARHILEILDKLGCDLIVMGMPRRSWLKRLLFGDLTEKVVRRARCPVLVVKAPTPARHPPVPEKAQTVGASKSTPQEAPQSQGRK
jgi:nucleotide-binding universal stress UspA family protein